MIDPELKTQLDQINQNLAEIKKKSGRGVWKAFFNGMFSALGQAIGWVVILVILVLILQKMGLLKQLEDQMSSFTQLVETAKKLVPDSNVPVPVQKPGSQTPDTSGQSVITLPNGQQYRVNVSQ